MGLKDLLRRQRPHAPTPPPALTAATPLFVLGPPRSGTTLVAKVLDAHPEVLITNETRIITFFEHAFREIPKGDAGGLHCAREHGDAVVATLRHHGAAIVRETYQRIAARTGKAGARYWGDKNPHLANSLPLVAEWFPNAKYVAVRRDPRDTVCSILELWARMKLVPPRDTATGRWDVPEEKFRSVCESVRTLLAAEDRFLAQLPAGRAFRVEYERIVRDPETVLDALFIGFLGLAGAAEPRARLAAIAQSDVHGAVRGNVDFVERSIGRWRRDFTPEQRDVVASEFAAV